MMSISELARRFNDATARHAGTDTQQVFEILEEVRRRPGDARLQFTEAVFYDLPYAERAVFLQKGNGNVVHGIFLTKFNPTFRRIDLAMAQLLYDDTTTYAPGYRHIALTTLADIADSAVTALKWGAALFLTRQ